MFRNAVFALVGVFALGAFTTARADYVLTGSYPNGDTYTDTYVTGENGTLLYKDRATKRNGKVISKTRYFWTPGANGHYGWNSPSALPLTPVRTTQPILPPVQPVKPVQPACPPATQPNPWPYGYPMPGSRQVLPPYRPGAGGQPGKPPGSR